MIQHHSWLGDDGLDLSWTQRDIHHAPYLVVPILELGGCEYNKGEITYVHRSQVVGNDEHEITYSGAHVKCKAYQREWLKFY
jgi:hypothetical protein